jgi:hypothetical protein
VVQLAAGRTTTGWMHLEAHGVKFDQQGDSNTKLCVQGHLNNYNAAPSAGHWPRTVLWCLVSVSMHVTLLPGTVITSALACLITGGWFSTCPR